MNIFVGEIVTCAAISVKKILQMNRVKQATFFMIYELNCKLYEHNKFTSNYFKDFGSNYF